MLKRFWYLFLFLLVEGASLMAVELLGAKLLAPFYGSSLYVWTAVLSITVLGLTLGYHIGGEIPQKYSNEKSLVVIITLASILVFAMPVMAEKVIGLTADMSIISGVSLSSFLLLVPPMFCFGLVGPMVVRLMTVQMKTIGNVAGTVYFTSTFGGIIATFLFGFYLIPEVGLKWSSAIVGFALIILPIIFLLKKTLLPDQITSSEVTVMEEPLSKNKKTAKKQDSIIVVIPKSFYLFAALEGCTVMAIELLAARMLAPYFGASLYVWATVIGTTLLSLALGYYFGGKLADKYSEITILYWVLLAAAFCLLFMHSVASYFTMAFTAIDLQIAVVLVSILLIVPPLLLLGMVPTLLINYLSNNFQNVGVTTGRVFTISSASGILALPLLGFWLIPHFGLTGPSIKLAFLVAIVPIVKLVQQKKYVALLFVVVFFNFLPSKVKATISSVSVLEYSEGLLGQVLVADVFKSANEKTTNDRILFVNRMGQTNINANNQNSNWNYIPFTASIASKLPAGSKALLLGLGGGSVANMLQNQLEFSVDAVELDERISKVATDYFSLSPKVNVVVDDARHYVETTSKKYDLIIFDVFKGDVFPSHVLSLECFERIKSLLNPNGMIVVNFNGFLSGEIGKPGRSVYKTLVAAELDTKILPTPGKEEERNTLFIATLAPTRFNLVRSPLLFKGKPVNVESLFLDLKGLNIQDAFVFTDDKPNLDRLNIEAGNAWRTSYNKSYTQLFIDNGIPLFE